ncbi:MAG: hypothetical protein Q8R30_04755 [bacterium]|nr:hypothetical protein [bacterium]
MKKDIKQFTEGAKKKGIPTPSAILADGSIVEMVYLPEENRTRFAIFRDDKLTYEDALLFQGRRLVPYSPHNNLLANDVVLFPSQAEDYGTEGMLVGEVQGFIHRYVDVSPLFEQIAAYYVLFTWIYDSFNELPYLRVRGDMGSGKTRFLLTVGSLCYKPIFASGASTVSPLFRLLHIFRGTLIIDEGDFRFSDEKAEVIKILNNGNARGFPVLRSESSTGKEFSPRAYQVYGPKLVATRGFFQDKALESRCLTEEMGHRRLRQDIPLNFTGQHTEEARQLRGKLLMFRFRNFRQKPINPALVDHTLEPRLNQVFVPLLSMIEDEHARDGLKRIAREYQKQLISDRGLDAEAQVLEILQALTTGIFTQQEPALKTITSQFIEAHEKEYDRKITVRWIGGLLKRLGFKTERKSDGYVIPVSELSKLEQLYEKYGLAPPPDPAEGERMNIDEQWPL